MLSTSNAGGLMAPLSVSESEMEVRIVRGTVAAGKSRQPGEVITVAEGEARLLLNLGKAEPAPEKKWARKKPSESE